MKSGQRETVHVPALHALTVVASASGAGSVVKLPGAAGNALSIRAVAAGESKIFGPSGLPASYEITCAEAPLTYEVAPVDFEAPDETSKGAIGSYTDADDGAVELLAAARENRVVQIVVHVTEVFADGDGAQPTLLIGETGDTDKFAAAAVFTDAAVGAKIVLVGTLAADKALLLTQTAATGTTSTGAYTVSAIAAPLA